MEDAFESVAFAAAPAPERNELLTPPLTKRFGFANQKEPRAGEERGAAPGEIQGGYGAQQATT